MAIIENINVSSPNDGLGDSLRDSQIKANNNFAELNDKKVEKVAGKDLTANDFTDILKTKLDGIEDGADVQIQADWIQTDTNAKDYIKNKPELGEYFSAVGGFDYEDLATQTTPLTYTTGSLWLTNDTLGANTKTNLNPYGVSRVWDEATNAFDFNQLSIGDEVILRVHLSITTTTANQISGLSLIFAEGLPSEYILPIDLHIYHKTAGTHDLIREISFYIGNEDWRTLPVKLHFNSDGNADIQVYGWHPYIIRKSINILDVNDDNYKTFTITNIEADNDDTTVTEGGVSIGYNSLTNKINGILFDIPFSSYIYNYDQLKLIYDFSINFVDKTNGKSFTSFINSFSTFGSHYKLDLNETLNYTDYSVSDKIEVFINATKKTTGGGVSSHSQLTLDDGTNPHNTTKNDVGLSNVPNLDTSTTANITDSTNKRFVSDDDLIDLGNLSNTNTGDETTATIQTKRPLKTIEGQSIEGTGNVDLAVWNLEGNNAISTNFLGTTNNVDLNFRRNNANAGKIQTNNTTLGVISGESLDPLNANNNTAIGSESLLANVISDNNTAIGTRSLYGATNSNNTAVGAFSLGDQTNGSANTALGYNAGRNHNGSNNIFIGKDCALGVLGAGSNNILIGVNANFVGGGALSNQINIGDFLYKSSTGDFGIDINTPTAKLDVNGSTRLRGTLLDINNEAGTSGQILSSTGTGIDWVDLPSVITPNLQQVTDVGSTTTNQIEVDTTTVGTIDSILGINLNVGGGNGVGGFSQVGFGVYGDSVNGSGVYGESNNDSGIYGLSENSLGGKFETINGSKIASFFTNNVEKAFIDSDGDIKIKGIIDTNDVLGTSGQILSSTGVGIDWIDLNLNDKVNSITTGEPTGSDKVINMVSLTQAEYDAGTKIPTTFYIITP